MITIEYVDQGATRTLKFEDEHTAVEAAAEWYLNDDYQGKCTVFASSKEESNKLWELIEGEMHK
jgi:hypothetical protein